MTTTTAAAATAAHARAGAPARAAGPAPCAADAAAGVDFAALLLALGVGDAMVLASDGTTLVTAAPTASDDTADSAAPATEPPVLPWLPDAAPSPPQLVAPPAGTDDLPAPEAVTSARETAASLPRPTPAATLPVALPPSALAETFPALAAEGRRARDAVESGARPLPRSAATPDVAPETRTAAAPERAEARLAPQTLALREPAATARDATAERREPVAAAAPLHALVGFTPTQAAAAPAAAPTASLAIAAPLGSAEFAPALAAQVTVLARDGVQQAELRLNPAEMGPIAVRIEVADGALATVHFVADVAATRDALEGSLPELAGALREAGLTLVGGGVSEHPQQSARGQQTRAGADGAAADEPRAGDHDAPADSGMPPRRTRGVVDLVA